jgi:hypothetical protein
MIDIIDNDDDNNNNRHRSYYNSKEFPQYEKYESPLEEKWIVSFIKSNNLNKIYFRQFYAAGFYEAYDKVMTFMEKTNYAILWYKEKRKCDQYFKKKEIPFLEYICTFCNRWYNNIEPIKCNFNSEVICASEFCSFNCRQDHLYVVHIKRKL